MFDTFFTALKGKRVMSYNGLYKDAMKFYREYQKIKDQEEKEEHVMHKYINISDVEYTHTILYRWGHGKYVEHEIRELTEEEKKRINKICLDDDG